MATTSEFSWGRMVASVAWWLGLAIAWVAACVAAFVAFGPIFFAVSWMMSGDAGPSDAASSGVFVALIVAATGLAFVVGLFGGAIDVRIAGRRQGAWIRALSGFAAAFLLLAALRSLLPFVSQGPLLVALLAAAAALLGQSAGERTGTAPPPSGPPSVFDDES